MSFLKNVFGASDEEKPNNKMEWNQLTAMDQLDLIVSMSEEKSRSMQSRFKVEELQDMYYRPSNAEECSGCGCGAGGCP